MIEKIQKELFNNQDIKYRDFTAKLVPNIDSNRIIGVRNPVLKKIAKNYYKEDDIDVFLNDLPHKYQEEDNLHSYLLSLEKDYEKAINNVNEFLPYISNWATCDILNPVCFKKNKDKLVIEIKKWLKSDKTYTLRFAIQMLMNHYLDEDFDKSYLKLVSKIRSKEYYVNMMIAWYYATALAKQYDDTVVYLEEKCLDIWVHNKTIQKAVESYRISDTQKEYLKSLKIKS